MSAEVYRFGPFRLDAAERRLWSGAEIVHLPPRGLDLLIYLVRSAGRLVTRERILEEVWSDVHVGDAALSQMVRKVRVALGDTGESSQYVETIPKTGYRFVAPVQAEGAPLPAPAPAARPAALPAAVSSFVGRDAEIRALERLLLPPEGRGARLVTLTGPGGVGKTRLARQLGALRPESWPGGLWLCDLSEATDAGGVCAAVAAALDVPPGRGEPAVQLGHALAGRGRCLVILDNVEQVIEGASPLVAGWLQRAPEATLLVTSREPLHVEGEQRFAVGPLPLPPAGAPPAALLASEAGRLFLDRARQVRPDLELGEEEAPVVAQLLAALDGLPLAIELAAARAGALSPAQMLARLSRRFDLLADGRRDAPARQATLRATLDWSWELLQPEERAALAQCAVFHGGFDLDAAEAVLRLPADRDPLDVIDALCDQSLLRAAPAPGGAMRYSLLESIRAYALERLAASGPDGEGLKARHAAYYADFGSEERLASLESRGGIPRRRKLVLERENLLAVIDYAASAGEAGLAAQAWVALAQVHVLHGPYAEAARVGDRVVALPGLAGPERARALRAQGGILWAWGRSADARAAYEAALAAATQDHPDLVPSIEGALGALSYETGRMDEARLHLERALAADPRITNTFSRATWFGNLAYVDIHQGRLDAAQERLEAALRMHAQAGNRRMEGIVLGNLGLVHFYRGELDEAEARYEAALAALREVGNRQREGSVLDDLGDLARIRGQLDRAGAYLEAGLAIHRALGSRRSEGLTLWVLGMLQQQRGDLAGAKQIYEESIAISREVGNPRAEGAVLARLGGLLAQRGDVGAGRERLEAGEALLRGVGDQLELALALCIRAEVERDARDRAAAYLAEAEAIAERLGVSEGSELGMAVARAREAVSARA